MADKLRKGWIESSAFFLSDFNWEAYVVINPRARPPPSASRGAQILQMDTQGHHLCRGQMSFRCVQHRVASLMDAADPGPAWTEVTHCTPSPAPHRDTSGDQDPPGSPQAGHGPCTGSAKLPGHCSVNSGQSHQPRPVPCPSSVPVPCPARPRPSPPADIGAASRQREGRGPSGAAAPCALWPAACHKLRTPGSINPPGNKNQGK